MKYLKALVIILSIIFLLIVIAAVYVNTIPDSRLSSWLRRAPVFSLFMPDVSDNDEYMAGEHGRHHVWSNYGAVALLAGTHLYSEPSEAYKTSKIIEKSGRYVVAKRKFGGWAQIKLKGGDYWVGPDRFNVQNFELSDQERSLLWMDRNILDYPKDLWYETLVQKRLNKRLNEQKGVGEWRKIESPNYVLYVNSNFAFDLDVLNKAVSQLRAEYVKVLGTELELKKEVFKPNFLVIEKKDAEAKETSLTENYNFGIAELWENRDQPEQFLNSFLHEYTHHLNLVVLRLGDESGSYVWLDEGLATYFSNIAYNSVVSFEGEIKKKHGRRFSPSRNFLGFTEKMFKNENQFDLESITQDKTWGEKDSRPVYPNLGRIYATNWAFAVFLLNGDEGKYRKAFLAYIKSARDGRGDVNELIRDCGFESLSALSLRLNVAVSNYGFLRSQLHFKN